MLYAVLRNIYIVYVRKGKATPVTGHEDPYGCETSRLSHYLNNRLTGGGEVVILMRRPPFTLQKNSWYSFLLEAESKSNDLIGIRTHDLPACSIVPQPTTLPNISKLIEI
jgi:hypothetical protein